jgi:predicted RNA-binding Zn ribbon-like protein
MPETIRAARNRKHVRWPAPDDLRRDGVFACLDFVNSEWTDWRGDGAPTDRLSSPDWWKRFLNKWGLGAPGLAAPSGPRLTDLRRVRKMMRAVMQKGRMPRAGEVMWLNRRLASSTQRWTLGAVEAGFNYRVVPVHPDWAAVTSALILSFSQLLNHSDMSRLKKCANPDCSYLFYDATTNLSRRWCFSNVCGNMMHVRAFRARRNE